MLRVILRKVQGGLIISAALLVVLAFQRLHSYDVPVLVGHFNHHQNEHEHDDGGEYSVDSDGAGGGRELVGHGHAHGRHRIFATNVIEIGLFRFVVPFRWTSTSPEDSEAARRETKEGGELLLPPRNEGGRGGGPRGGAATLRKTRPRAASRPTRPSMDALNDRPNLKTAPATRGASTIGYAVTISKCPSDDLLLSQGLAVLSRSVHRHSAANPESKSRYGHKMYGIIHPDAEGCARDALVGLGFEVVTAGGGRQKKIGSGGAGGGDEKTEAAAENDAEDDATSLHAYRLLDHPIVVQLDPMSLLMGPLDQLFDAMLGGPGSELSRKDLPVATTPHGGSGPNNGARKLPGKIDVFLTRETAGDGGKTIRRGFRVVRTGRDSFDELSLLADGRNGTKLAASSGNVTAQQQRRRPPSPPPSRDVGLYSLYYDQIHPGTSVDLDPCVFGADGSGTCLRKAAKVVSLASCPEPWSCTAAYGNDDTGRFCREAHRMWFQLRRELVGGALPPAEEGGHSMDQFLGYCKSEGYLGYIKYDVPVISLAAAKLKRWLFRRHL